MKKAILLILILTFSFSESYSQNIFPKVYPGCNTDRFTLERDSPSAQIDETEFIQVITSGFSDKTKEKINGTLSLQIIVDYMGNSCLISLKNETNIKTKKLNVKESIDSFLKWKNPEMKVSAIIILDFEESGITFSRLGVDAEKGVHVLQKQRFQ